MDRLQRVAFKHQIRYVGVRSKFYRERFAECGIDPNRISHPSQMGDFFTYAEEIRQRPASDFLCAKPQIAFETTGTTSAIPKKIYFSNSEMQTTGRFAAVGMWNLGLRPDDRLVSAFDAGVRCREADGFFPAATAVAGRRAPSPCTTSVACSATHSRRAGSASPSTMASTRLAAIAARGAADTRAGASATAGVSSHVPTREFAAGARYQNGRQAHQQRESGAFAPSP